MACVAAIAASIVSMFDRSSTREYRPLPPSTALRASTSAPLRADDDREQALIGDRQRVACREYRGAVSCEISVAFLFQYQSLPVSTWRIPTVFATPLTVTTAPCPS
jgi:hypothetical protein